jgi:hypothetical protein
MRPLPNQRPLFSGLGCLPGQQDLFATDGELPPPPDYTIPSTETPVVDLVITGEVFDVGPGATKHLSPQHRYRYTQTCSYHLADGRQTFGEIRALTRPKLAAKVQRLRDNIARAELFAVHRGSRYCGLATKLSLMMR